MINVFDVANYIVNHYKKDDLTEGKLEELVYYCQAWNLVFLKKPLFSSTIKGIHLNGCICPKLNKKYKKLHSLNELDQSKVTFTDNQKIIMNNVIKYYGHHSAWYLKQLTNLELKDMIADNLLETRNINKRAMEKYYSTMVV